MTTAIAFSRFFYPWVKIENLSTTIRNLYVESLGISEQTLKVGTHQATSCSNTSRRQSTPCVQVGRLVAAPRWGDTMQRQSASCVLENFYENLCFRNRILSLQQVAKNQIRLNLYRQRFWQNSPVHTKRFFAAKCRRDMLPACRRLLFPLLATRHVAVTCRPVCTDFKYSGEVSLIISVDIHRELTQCVRTWDWDFTLCLSSTVASTFIQRQYLQSLEISKRVSCVLRGIKRAVLRKWVKITDCQVSSFLKTVPGCRVSRHGDY